MDLEDQIVGRVIYYFRQEMKVREDLVLACGDKCVELYGFRFTLSIDESNIDVAIDPPAGKRREFESHLKRIETGDFWKGDSMRHLRDSKNKYKGRIKNRKFYQNGDGRYHFKAEVRSSDPLIIVNSLIVYVIRPVLLFKRSKVTSQ